MSENKITDKEMLERHAQGLSASGGVQVNVEQYNQPSLLEDSKFNDFVDEVKNYISRVYVGMYNFYDINFKNLQKQDNDLIKEFNFERNMNKKLQLLTKLKMEYGKMALGMDTNGNDINVHIFYIQGAPKYENGKLTEIICTKNIKDENNNETFYKYYITNKKSYVDEFVYLKDKTMEIKQTKVIKGIDYIPLTIFHANESGEPEHKYAIASIELYATFNEKLRVEWEYIKTQIIKDGTSSSNNDTEAMSQNKVEKGKDRVIKTFTGDVQQDMALISGTGATAEVAKGIVEHFWDNITRLLFLISRTKGSNNKQTTEAMNDNLYAYANITSKANLLSFELCDFYFKVIDLCKKSNCKKFSSNIKYLDGEVQFSKPYETLLNFNENKQPNKMKEKMVDKGQGE